MHVSRCPGTASLQGRIWGVLADQALNGKLKLCCKVHNLMTVASVFLLVRLETTNQDMLQMHICPVRF